METDKKKANYVISWLLISVVAKMKVRESAGLDLDWSELRLLASEPPAQGKNYVGMTAGTSKTLVTKKVVHVGRRQNQETTKTGRYNVKELLYFID